MINNIIGFDNLNMLVLLGLLFFISQVSGKVANYFGAPRITGYLMAGLVFGPYALNVFSIKAIHTHLNLVTNISLSLIAFSIGRSLRIKKLKEHHGSILWITFFESFMAFMMVFVCVFIFLPFIVKYRAGYDFEGRFYLPISIVFAAILAATAPAAILSIVHEYKSKGRLTLTLLRVVAIDDAFAVIFYSFATLLTSSMVSGEEVSWLLDLIVPLKSVFGSFLIGAMVGLVIRLIVRFFGRRSVLLGIVVGAICFTSGMALIFHCSPILSNMMFGMIVTNFVDHKQAELSFEVIESIQEPIFGAFFLLAGAHLSFEVLDSALLLAVFITISRFLGKILGAYVGASICSAPYNVRKYLGMSLLPTAGVTIGLALEAKSYFYQYMPVLTDIMVSGIIGSTMINELITPFILRWSLMKTGEIKIK